MTLNRSHLVKEYFELKLFLNRGNLHANETTKVTYLIRTEKEPSALLFYATLSEGPKPLVLLCRRLAERHWLPTGYSRFEVFEQYCALTLNEIFENIGSRKLNEDTLNKIIHNFENGITDLGLDKKLF